MLTYKFRLYPTKTQEKKLEETFETCRRLYNRMLDDRLKNHTAFFEQKKKLVELKKEDKYLKEVHSQVLQDVVLRLDKAFESYFAGLSKFPRFKRKGRYNSFTYPQHEVGFRLIGNIKMRIHRVIEGKIKTATIIRDVDQWFVALSVEKQANNTNTNTLNQNAKAIGVDLGITNAIALSDGALIQGRPKFLRKAEERIK